MLLKYVNKNYLGIILLFSILIFLFIFPSQSNAAAVSVTVTPSSIANNDNFTNKVVNFIPVTVLNNSDIVYVFYPETYDDSTLVSGDISITKLGDGNFNSASKTLNTTENYIEFLLVTSGNLDTTNDFEITFTASKLISSSTGGVNESFKISTNDLVGGGDIGGSVQYVGNLNEVNVSAVVTPNLSISIRKDDDTAELPTLGTSKVCNLGSLDLISVSSCYYRLKVSTNADNGYSVSYNSNTRFTNGSYNINDAPIGGGGVVLVPGTENYGIILTPGSITEPLGTITRNLANFGNSATSAYRITESAEPYLMASANGYNAPTATDVVNTILIEHQIAISASTQIGLYSHKVTYTVTANF